MGQQGGFRVAPQLRLRAVHRGPRMLLGPKFVATPVAAVADGDDPKIVRQWIELADGGRPRSSATSDTADPTFGQREHLDRLLHCHEVALSRAQRPVIARPPAVDRQAVRRELVRRSVRGVPFWRVTDRRERRRAAREAVDAEVARRQADRDADHAAEQAAADEWWQRLEAGDAPTTLHRLTVAFEQAGLSAVPTDVGDRAAHVAVAVDSPEMLIGQREPTADGQGMSLAIMSETRRNKLYVQAVCAGIVAVAAEVFAVAPGIDEVRVAVVAPSPPHGPAVLAITAMSRDVVLPDGKDRAAVDDLIRAAQQGRLQLTLERTGLADAPRPLDPEIAAVRALLDATEG